ncbi:MAG: TraR/DksA C4-type zinc finger protein [Deltaproteobacteria bacterium]|nr:TraR/DksA C4-type zinc finger protein [Deltaproteobacteria bacterium]
MWNDLRDDIFRKLGREYNSQFDNPYDLEELSIIDLIEDTGLAIADMRREQLEKLDEALRKIDDGTYGICNNCGSEIDEERLKAVAFAEYCVDCKKSQEKEAEEKKFTL